MDWKKYVPKNWKEILAWLAFSLATALAGYLLKGTPVPDNPLPPPVPVWEPGPENMGWVPDPEAVKQVVAGLQFKVFADTPAGQVEDPLPRSVYLWDAYRKQYGRPPPSRNQLQVGSCVSFGTCTAIERTMIVAIVLKGELWDYRDLCQENVYGGSRVQVGKGRLGRSDGSVGAWAAEYVNKWGVVERKVHELGGKKYDLQTYSEQLCRQWGSSGVPGPIAELAREHPVQDITLVKTWAEAKKALSQGYGIAICSGQGFNMQRDSRGVAQARGSWAHCMALDGFHTDEAGKEYGHIENSWGEKSHTGPVGWGDPPVSGFWADSTTISRMLAQGDSWAFATVKGFPSSRIDWFVFRRPQGLRQWLPEQTTLFARLERQSHAVLGN